MTPHSLEAEVNVLSSIFLDGAGTLQKALDARCDEAWFYDPINQKVWRAFLWLFRANKPLTPEVMADELQRTGKLDEIGIPRITDISSAIVTTVDFRHWLNRLRDCCVYRQLYYLSVEVGERAQKQQGSPEDYVAKVHSILNVYQSAKKQKMLWEAALETVAKCDRIDTGMDSLEDRGMTWPWLDWNRRFGTCKQTELVILAARPSRGKSSAGRQIALHWAQNYGPTIYFSREMSVEEVTPLFAQSLSRRSWKGYKQLHSAEKQEFRASLKTVEGLGKDKLYLFETDRTINQLTARVRAFGALHPLRGIVIDYLQRYDPLQEKGETRDMALGRLTTALKDVALDMKIPVILLAQVGRGVEREDREPRLSDIREVGAAEADADRVIFFHWPTEKPDGTPQDLNDGSINSMFVHAIQAKGRGEGCDRVEMMFNRGIASFESIKHETNEWRTNE